MRGFVIATALFLVVTGLFVGGLFSTQSGLMMLGFCGMPFSVFMLGWSAKGLLQGRRFALVDQTMRSPRQQRVPANGRARYPVHQNEEPL